MKVLNWNRATPSISCRPTDSISWYLFFVETNIPLFHFKKKKKTNVIYMNFFLDPFLELSLAVPKTKRRHKLVVADRGHFPFVIKGCALHAQFRLSFSRRPSSFPNLFVSFLLIPYFVFTLPCSLFFSCFCLVEMEYYFLTFVIQYTK